MTAGQVQGQSGSNTIVNFPNESKIVRRKKRSKGLNIAGKNPLSLKVSEIFKMIDKKTYSCYYGTDQSELRKNKNKKSCNLIGSKKYS